MRQTLVIPCAHAECPNTLTLGADERQPKDWLCPTCEDQAIEQHMIALERATRNLPIKRMN